MLSSCLPTSDYLKIQIQASTSDFIFFFTHVHITYTSSHSSICSSRSFNFLPFPSFIPCVIAALARLFCSEEHSPLQAVAAAHLLNIARVYQILGLCIYICQSLSSTLMGIQLASSTGWCFFLSVVTAVKWLVWENRALKVLQGAGNYSASLTGFQSELELLLLCCRGVCFWFWLKYNKYYS